MDKDTRIAYGAGCIWWDNVQKAGNTGPQKMVINGRNIESMGLPCCPTCGFMLMEVSDEKEWFKGVDEYDKTYKGYRKFIEWQRGKCFAGGMPEALKQYFQETGLKVENLNG